VKHALVEVLRRMENARSLIYYAGWAGQHAPEEFPLAANAARVSAGEAFDFASRELISVHGGIGASCSHVAPLFFRRAQLSRRLTGGLGGAKDAVAGALLAAAA
jgi:alkylation response protein AidB-like acyl-CoA dehydrogenase